MNTLTFLDEMLMNTAVVLFKVANEYDYLLKVSNVLLLFFCSPIYAKSASMVAVQALCFAVSISAQG